MWGGIAQGSVTLYLFWVSLESILLLPLSCGFWEKGRRELAPPHSSPLGLQAISGETGTTSP